MTGQLSLLGGDVAEPKKNNRLMFLIYPPADIADQLEQRALALNAAHGQNAKPVPQALRHITLFHLDDHVAIPKGLLEGAGQAGASIATSCFDVTFDRAMTFTRQGSAPFVLRGDDKSEGLAALIAFRKDLGQAMVKAGVKWSDWNAAAFTPHVTLFYGAAAIERPIEPIRWQVREFALVHSHLGKTRHDVLAKWPLR